MRQRAADNRRLAEDLVSPLIPEQLGWRPAAGAWSGIEVLDHLNRTATGYQAGIHRVLV